MHFDTKVIHGKQEPDRAFGAVMPPIYQTSTYVQTSPGNHKGYEYSRTHNPTRTALQNAIASLDDAKYGMAFSSGMAAIDAVIKLLKFGDEIISINDLYGGSYRIFTKMYSQFKITTHFIDVSDAQSFEKAINKNTKLVWLETPTNPMGHIVDIQKISNITKAKNILLAVDNTFATPYLQKPLNFGADIVVYSATKYLGGHSDTVLGLITVSDDELAERLYFIQNASGAVPGPLDCFLVLRGIKTLSLRMQRHCENATQIAIFLDKHPKVEAVFWSGLSSHSNHELAKKQMNDFGGMLSFRLKEKTKNHTLRVLERFQVFTLAESLGGVESLVGHPSSMTHASIPKADREQTGVTENLIRLSIGIEHDKDLIADLKQAIEV